MLDVIVYIGRFQPPHSGHIETIKSAATKAKRVIVLIGSSWVPRNSRNPFTWEERATMIDNVMIANCPRYADNIQYVPIQDHLYSDAEWVMEVQSRVNEIASDISSNPKIGITGLVKDQTSYYLKMFPQWQFIPVNEVHGIDSTWFRKEFFSLGNAWELKGRKEAARGLHKEVIDFLDLFKQKEPIEYNRICRELEHINLYKKAWETAPYPPTFVTADAVVIQSGHVLMVKRGAMPGEGLWALPGGFVNQFETVEDACIRELREETKLKVPDPVLRGSIMAEKRFDHPLRSLRGRTITTAFFIKLQDGELPKVKGSDDAKTAKWILLSEFDKMSKVIFEDHYHIVKYFI